MRLNDDTKFLLIKGIENFFGKAEVYLFGSRTDDSKKGGDIDLAINAALDDKKFKKLKVKFMTYLLKNDFDYSVDLIQLNSSIDAILKNEILKEGIKIN